MQFRQVTIIKISLILFFILFLFLYIIENTKNPENSSISQIKNLSLRKTYQFNVNIVNTNSYEDFSYIKIKDNTGITDAIIFEPLANFQPQKEKSYTLIAQISKYKNKNQLIIKEIKYN
ncbi:MAG: hypothetical protein ACOCXG_04760 [Nanoarchaeota archaeon]